MLFAAPPNGKKRRYIFVQIHSIAKLTDTDAHAESKKQLVTMAEFYCTYLSEE
jgi:hypothetical protein